MANRSVAPQGVLPLGTLSDDDIIACALKVLERRARYGANLSAPKLAREYFKLKLAGLEHEVFCAAWLDSQNRVLEFQEISRGTLTQTAVYPREVVKAGLKYNASSVIVCHNHPSGLAEPSKADEYLTRALKDALTLVDIKLLDHLVVAGPNATSFAERGLL
jgi:DNA repair protein RadC